MKKKGEICMKLEYDIPQNVNMDPAKLEQVVPLTEQAIKDKITATLVSSEGT